MFDLGLQGPMFESRLGPRTFRCWGFRYEFSVPARNQKMDALNPNAFRENIKPIVPEIRRGTGVIDIVKRVAKLKWQCAGHIAQRTIDVGSQCAELEPRTGKCSAGTSSRRWTDEMTDGAAEPKQHKALMLGTPYKRPMSSSGRPAVDMMMS
ncbi:jg15136 [Pararge aegeria aegeria]|uniref:Jg15136 protein n=1 Tax=Pararge aegeria aegeria TaxID=348720 RepID=A0A8S4RYH4_9NEOP|nr:jg15136 [Pararge aegeria aegeria]